MILAHSSRYNGHLSEIHPIQSILVHWFLKCWCLLLLSSVWPIPIYLKASVIALLIKNAPATHETLIQFLGWEDPLEKGMANHFSILALRTPWTVWKGKNRTLKDDLPRSVGAQYVTGDQCRTNSRKNEGMEPKQQKHPVVDVTGDGSKVWCCKEEYCKGT